VQDRDDTQAVQQWVPDRVTILSVVMGLGGLDSDRQPALLTFSPVNDAVSEAGHSSTTGARLNDPAIAGDPHSVQRPVNRPRRAIRLPTRYKDFAV